MKKNGPSKVSKTFYGFQPKDFLCVHCNLIKMERYTGELIDFLGFPSENIHIQLNSIQFISATFS